MDFGKGLNLMALSEALDHTDAWRERIKADLAAQIEAGATLYGIREDGCFVARNKSGDRIISRKGEPVSLPGND